MSVRSAVGAFWRGARRLPPRQWPGVLRTVALVACVETGLRTARLPRVARWLGVPLAEAGPCAGSGTPGATGSEPMPLELAPRERAGVRDARRVLSVPGVDGTCLRQALVVGHVLRRRGPRLVLGVAKRDGTVSAHAWVEVQGWVVDDFHLHAGRPAGFERLPATPA
ncbi:hypothetical protein A0J59_09680 [Cellulosimicrobium sp. I38E]|nr:hypothetical protein A0J59_09680 [Cellulosimicrobium sp. I38E]